MAFDVLTLDGEDLRMLPYAKRRAALLDVSLCAPLAVAPATQDATAAKLWMREHYARGIEGVVAKQLDHADRPRPERGSR